MLNKTIQNQYSIDYCTLNHVISLFQCPHTYDVFPIMYLLSQVHKHQVVLTHLAYSVNYRGHDLSGASSNHILLSPSFFSFLFSGY